jgi:hypothetical protein
MVGGDAGMVVERARIRTWHRPRYVAGECPDMTNTITVACVPISTTVGGRGTRSTATVCQLLALD